MCGWWVSAEPQVWSTAVMPMRAPRWRRSAAVNAEGRRALRRRGRACQDDRGAVLHQRQRFLDGEQGAFHVGRERPVEVLFGDGSKRKELAASRVGEQHIDRAGLVADGREQAVEVGKLGYVALNAAGAPAHFGDRRVEFLLAAPCHEDAGAFRREELSGGQADAAVCAGDHGDLAFEPTHSTSLLTGSVYWTGAPSRTATGAGQTAWNVAHQGSSPTMPVASRATATRASSMAWSMGVRPAAASCRPASQWGSL